MAGIGIFYFANHFNINLLPYAHSKLTHLALRQKSLKMNDHPTQYCLCPAASPWICQGAELIAKPRTSEDRRSQIGSGSGPHNARSKTRSCPKGDAQWLFLGCSQKEAPHRAGASQRPHQNSCRSVTGRAFLAVQRPTLAPSPNPCGGARAASFDRGPWIRTCPIDRPALE